MSRHPGAGTLFTVAGNRAVDEPRVDLVQLIVAEPETLHDPGRERPHQDVGSLGERPQTPPRLGRLEVELDALLAAVQKREVDAVGPKLRRVRAHLVAPLGSFDLDDLGAGLGQYQGRQRSRQQRAEVQYPDTLQRDHEHPPEEVIPGQRDDVRRGTYAGLLPPEKGYA